MGVSSGLQSQVGIGVETTIGTRVAPSRYYEFTGKTLKFHQNRINSAGIRAGRRVLHRWAKGAQWVDGGFTMECAPQGLGLLLKHCFGGVATAGTNPYTHTLTPGALDALGLTIQANAPDKSGTDRPFDYLGCQVTDFEFTSEIDKFLMLAVNFYGGAAAAAPTTAGVDTAQTLGTASYPATLQPFTFIDGAITIAASAYDVKSISLKGDNRLATARHQIYSGSLGRPRPSKESGRRQFTGSFKSDFFDLTALTRFINGTEAAMVLTWTYGASAILTMTLNVRFDGDDPGIADADTLLELGMPFVCVSSTSDAAAITVTLTNADSTP